MHISPQEGEANIKASSTIFLLLFLTNSKIDRNGYKNKANKFSPHLWQYVVLVSLNDTSSLKRKVMIVSKFKS